MDIWLAIGIPMLLVGLGQGWLLAPIAGIHEVDASLSGAASGMTNTMPIRWSNRLINYRLFHIKYNTYYSLSRCDVVSYIDYRLHCVMDDSTPN